jgi:hypothetical protein
MQSIVLGVFPNVARAEAAFRALRPAGVDRDDVSVVTRQDLASSDLVDAERREPGGSSAGVGMATGAALGGAGGLLAGLGLLAVPGVGPVLAAGPIAAALAGAGLGAVGGALIGALVDLGVPEDQAPQLAEAVGRGGVLLATRVDGESIDRVVDVMEEHGALDVAEDVSGAREVAGPRGRGRVRVYRIEIRRRIA